MSRIGKKEIEINNKIKVNYDQGLITIDGPKGKLSSNIHSSINVEINNTTIKLTKNNNSKKTQALYGLSRSLINNMVIGVSTGFEKQLIIEGVGYRSQINGKTLILNVGYSHVVEINPPPDINIKVENNTNIIISGINKATVGEIAAKIRSVRPPEPYKGKGIRYANEIVRRKVGKAGK